MGESTWEDFKQICPAEGDYVGNLFETKYSSSIIYTVSLISMQSLEEILKLRESQFDALLKIMYKDRYRLLNIIFEAKSKLNVDVDYLLLSLNDCIKNNNESEKEKYINKLKHYSNELNKANNIISELNK